MKINISQNELRQRSIMVCTPMYGGVCTGQFTRSMCDLTALCTLHGIKLLHYYLFNESLITRARNYCTDAFMRSDCTHMLFLDSDIGFDAKDVIMMLALQSDDSPYDVLTAPYPKKCISWEKIKVAVEKGFADNDPNELEKYVGDFVINPKTGTNEVRLDEPVEVLEAGTGFMMIRRKTLQEFEKSYPEYYYRPDHVRTVEFDGSREIMMFFQAEIDPESKRYLSEDYWFCQKLQKIGMKIWLCPFIKTQHQGSYVFGGSIADLAQLGVSATCDESLLKKKKPEALKPNGRVRKRK